MDNYRYIEIEIAKKHGAVANGTKKSIGDFLLGDDVRKQVNVKSNNLDKKNYSPNIISAKRLIRWLGSDDHEMYLIFVDYKHRDDGLIEIHRDSGLVRIENLSWKCLTIEAQGWGVIQMCKPLLIDESQTRAEFFRGLRHAYEIFLQKERIKMEKIEKMIMNF